MNRSIRRVALGLGLAFAALLANLNYVQIARSRALQNNPANRRILVAEYSIERGEIVAGDTVLAQSAPTQDNLKFIRRYPGGDLYGNITGYYSIVYGRAGLERSFNDYLTGAQPASARDFIDDLLGRERKGNTLLLTLDPALQRAAERALAGQRGAIAAIDPATGAVLALYSNPGYDPSPLSSHDLDSVRGTWTTLNADPLQPLISRATQERYPPGSSFKVVTAAAGLELGKMTPSTSFPNPSALRLPDTNKLLHNFGGGACRGGGSISLRTALQISCNTTFAQVGLRVGAAKLAEMATRFGLNGPAEFDVPLVPSCLRPEAGAGCLEPVLNRPQTALSAIGQFDVRVTPLQMAMIAATIANGGYVVHPYLVREIKDFAGRTLKVFEPTRDGPIFSKSTASDLKAMMINVVRAGTGHRAAISGVEMGGKTGTAQTGVEGEAPHAWFIAFAPGIALAVLVEHGGNLGDEATGGKVAAPIARAVIEQALARKR